MKKLLFILPLLILLFVFSSNVKITVLETWKEFKLMFKKTEYLNLEINEEIISKIFIKSTSMDMVELKSGTPYIDSKKKIKNVILRLNSIPLKAINEEELISYSPDTIIYFVDNNDNILEKLWIYNQSYIMNITTDKLYSVRDDNIIDLLKEVI